MRALVVALVSIAFASCGSRLARLPSTPGEPAPDMAAAMAEALGACGAVGSMTAEIAATGSVGGRRMRARLLGGFTPAAFRLEAVTPAGPPFFILVANGDDATLLLPRDDRVLPHEQSDAVLEAIAGIRLKPTELFETLIGCAAPGKWTAGFAAGENWRVAVGEHGAKLYLHRESRTAPWRVATLLYPGEGLQWSWRADYSNYHSGLPYSVRLVSATPGRFDLQLSLSQVEPGAPLDRDVFRVQIPASAQPITLAELRESGPLAPRR